MIYFGLKPIIKLFKRGNCQVFGEKGDGKDVLFGNVIARRKSQYISNVDYTHDDRFIPLDLSLLHCGYNTYENLLSNHVKFYEYPYPEGCDIYLSDTGVYLPSQYNGELNRKYPFLPTFLAVQRHLSNGGGFHSNTQSLSRPWDKLREQGRRYIRCRGLFKPLMKYGICIQRVTIYSKYQSGVDCVEPCRIRVPIFCLDPNVRLNARMHRDKFFNQYGEIKTHYFIYRNLSKHDTHHFKKLFLGGIKQ